MELPRGALQVALSYARCFCTVADVMRAPGLGDYRERDTHRVAASLLQPEYRCPVVIITLSLFGFIGEIFRTSLELGPRGLQLTVTHLLCD